MTGLTEKDIEALATRLQEFSGLSVEEHREQHDAIKIFIHAQNEKIARWNRIRESTTGWLVIVILGSIGTLIYSGFKDLITKIVH